MENVEKLSKITPKLFTEGKITLLTDWSVLNIEAEYKETMK